MEIRTREQYISYIRRTSTIPMGNDGSTPIKLIEEMIDNLPIDWSNPNLKILDPCFGFGGFLFFVYLKLKDFHSEKHILENMLYGIEIEDFRFTLVKHKLKIKNLYLEDALNPSTKLKELLDMKEFDVVLGNWPYEKKVGPNKTQAIWDKFTELFLTKVKTKYLMPIHPSGWRNINGNFKNLQKMIFERNLKYLEIHNEKDGLKTFGKETRYDWFILENTPNKSKTRIKFQSGNIEEVNVKEFDFLPNDDFEKIYSLIAKDNEERVNLLYSRSDYGTDKKNTNQEKTSEFKYPCVYTVNSESQPTFYYSNTTQNGHFDIPKFIWSNGRISSIGSYIDETGEYALTQFSYGIIDEPENLPLIKKAFDSIEFRNLMESCAVGQLTVNHKIISLFRKDFWKEFIND